MKINANDRAMKVNLEIGCDEGKVKNKFHWFSFYLYIDES